MCHERPSKVFREEKNKQSRLPKAVFGKVEVSKEERMPV
jgi:hypothetical protein